MKKNTQIVILAVIFLFFLIGFALWLVYNMEHEKGEGDVFVIDVIDGDTFRMSDSSVIRLLCVDTPEKGEVGYERAIKFLESLLSYKEVRLEKAETLDEIDKYNRELRFVYVNTSVGEIFINKEIVRLGFGDFYDYKDVEGECEGIFG